MPRPARWIPAALWYGVIWFFSSQTGTESQEVSDGVLELFGYDIKNSLMVLSELLSFLVRKAGHMFIFFVLAGLLYFALRAYLARPALQLGLSAALAAALAAGDEFHQTFVPGRSGTVRDVFIDCLGVAAFSLCCLAAGAILKRRRGKTPVEIH